MLMHRSVFSKVCHFTQYHFLFWRVLQCIVNGKAGESGLGCFWMPWGVLCKLPILWECDHLLFMQKMIPLRPFIAISDLYLQPPITVTYLC